jgi:hypothetical protein
MPALLLWLALVVVPQIGAHSGAPAATSGGAAALDAVVNSAKFKAAAAALDRDFDRHVADTIRLTEIPSPPFKEAERAKVYAELFRQLGLSDVEIDAEGNVLGVRKGSVSGQAGQRPLVAFAAHLDTVFPEGTNVKVKRDGTRLYAPGVGAVSRSLAVVL